MKTLYCITSGSPDIEVNPNYILLKEACNQQGINFHELAVPTEGVLYSEIPTVGEGGVYLLNIQSRCSLYLFGLIKKNPHLKHMLLSGLHAGSAWTELMNDEAEGVPIIPTLYTPSSDPADFQVLAAKIEEQLSGFPVIVKQAGGTRGTGIIYIDSMISLKTLLPHLVADNSKDYVIKKFIKKAKNYRIVVLDDRVLCVTEYFIPNDDIRTNAAKEPIAKAAELPSELREVAIRAVQCKNRRFGGVDMLIDEEGLPYIAEVNIPCNFSRSQNLTGVPIATEIVQYLCQDKTIDF